MENIFKHSGQVNVELDPAMVPPERRSQYIALRDAQIGCDQAEANEKSANEAVAELVKAHDRALAALPRSTFLDEWRRSVEAVATAHIDQLEHVPVEPALVSDPLTALKDAERDLDLARFEARQCRAATVSAKLAFAKALENWNRAQPVVTADQAARAFIATAVAERARKAAAGQLARPVTVGQMARALGGGGHRAQRGGGAAYRRGAYSKAQALEINANRLRAAAAARKLPSER